MTHKQISDLNYLIGKVEGIAAGCSGDVQTALLDAVESLLGLLHELEGGNQCGDHL